MSQPDQTAKFRTQCPHLRSKEMYYEAPGQEEDAFSSGTYWCMLTQEGVGPDGQPVTREDCCSGRGCFAG
jgi:hypothetical protein